MIRDLRYAARQLRKSPGFTLTVLCTLALCIGANTAIYSVVDAVLLRPLPYPEPDRLGAVTFKIHSAKGDWIEDAQDGATWETIRDNATQLDAAVIAGGAQGVNLAKDNRAEYVKQFRVSSGYFRVLGVLPRLGREFTPTEDTAGGAPVVVLTDALWRRSFAGDPAVVGQSILLRGEPYTVVGVMPPGFRIQTQADLFTPLRPSRTGEGQGTNYQVIARLKPGVTWAAANAQLDVVAKPVVMGNANKDVSGQSNLIPLQEGMTLGMRTTLLTGWAAVAMVLLIGCVNVAGLLLARAGSRSREVATRMAIGATRAAIIRQLLAESLLLAVIGGALGAAIGYAGIQALSALGADGFDYWYDVTLNLRVLAATICISVATALIFGLAPAFAASRIDLRAVLVEGGRGSAGSTRHWSRRALIVGEVALSLVLLAGAGLLIRTLEYLQHLKPGFDPHNVVTASLSLQDARYQTATSVNQFYGETLRRIRAMPEVESAGVGLTLPYQRPLNMGFRVADGPNADNHGKPMDTIYVTPGYLEALRIPLIEGRSINEADRAESEPVMLVNEAFARRFLKGQSVVGSHLKSGSTIYRVVGIVGDTQQHSGLGSFGPMSPSPTTYTPATQLSEKSLGMLHTWFAPQFVLRTRTAPSAELQREVEAAVTAVDPLLPFASFRTMESVQFRAFKNQRYQATVFSALAGLAMLLAAVGLYGLIAHSVTERTREMGIRMALGASFAHTMWMVIRPALWMTVGGIAAGAALARFATKLLVDSLWGVKPQDPMTFAAVAGMLLAVSLIASAIPALRLLRLDPAETLRAE